MTGVVVNALYDFWTPARHYQAYHAGLRILSESASARLASPITVKPDQIQNNALGYNPRESSWNYLEPWKGGTWTISPQQSLNIFLPGIGVPIEEAIFFLVTNTLLIQGMILFLERARIKARVCHILRTVGKSKPEVLQAMVAQYGERILAAPTKEGFNLTAWIIPFVMLVAGGLKEG